MLCATGHDGILGASKICDCSNLFVKCYKLDFLWNKNDKYMPVSLSTPFNDRKIEYDPDHGFVSPHFLQMRWSTEVNGTGLLGWAYFNFICQLKEMIHLAIPYCAKNRFVQ